MNASEALEFLARQVEQQAKQENAPLSTSEKQMLRWSEVEPRAFRDAQASKQFDRDYESDEYEAKIAGLLKRAYARDSKELAGLAQWNEAKTALTGHDYYLLVMTRGIFGDVSLSGAKRRLAFLTIPVILIVIAVIWQLLLRKK